MTLVRTTPGWLYLAVVLNLYSRADAPPHAAGGVRRVGDDRRMPTAERRGAAALGSWSAYAYLALLGDIESRPAIHVQGTARKRRDRGILSSAEDRAGIPDALYQPPLGENRPVRLRPLLQSPSPPLDAGLSQSDGV